MLRLAYPLLVFGLLTATGCNSVLGLGDYEVGKGAGQGGSGGSAGCEWDPDSGACYPCAPANDRQYLNACTESTCEPFDDKVRVTNLPSDGTLPSIPDAPTDAGGAQ